MAFRASETSSLKETNTKCDVSMKRVSYAANKDTHKIMEMRKIINRDGREDLFYWLSID